MKAFKEMTKDERASLYAELQKEYEAVKAEGLKLDMSRGKPSKEQLTFSREMLLNPVDTDACTVDGVNACNYGELMGMPAARALFAELLGVEKENVFVGGNASLQLMAGLLEKAYIWGLKNSPKPWAKAEKVKWLCPAPGYDRHFRITETLGMELITVPMHDDGPDMDTVEELVKDPAVKGIWCVPKYSNPTGAVYSAEVIARFTKLKPAAPDFTVMWDNAYCVHEFKGEYVPFPSILKEAEKQGSEDMFYEFASTSKLTLPGAGIGCMVCSKGNMEYLKKFLGMEIISFDKLNQLRHVLFLKDKAGVLEHMKKHAASLGPKFELVTGTFEKELGPLGVCSWTDPKGGYFVNFTGMDGTAKRIVSLMKEAGVILTGAGAAFPYGVDPDDSSIRIAPSMPPLAELEKALAVFCLCVKMASLEKLA